MRHSIRVGAVIAAATTLGLVAVTAAVSADTKPSTAASTADHPVDAVGLSSDGRTLSVFSLAHPDQVREVHVISGLQGDTVLIGIDMRIANRAFYGVGNQGGIYTLNRNNARVTKVGQLTVALQGTNFDIDFNPAADRLRIISDTGQNLRHDVNPGGATLVDGTLAYVAGTPATGLTAGGYTNNDVSTATGTTLIDIDTTLNQVVQQIPANDGTLALSGPLGINATEVAGFDIWTGRRGGNASSNLGFATLRTPWTQKSVLFSIDLLSGKATRIGSFGGADIADLAVIQP